MGVYHCVLCPYPDIYDDPTPVWWGLYGMCDYIDMPSGYIDVPSGYTDVSSGYIDVPSGYIDVPSAVINLRYSH